MASPSTSKSSLAGTPASGNFPAKPVQPDLFAQLGVAPRYDVDLKELEAAFFAKSKELHPDRFASAPAAERVAALSKSRAFNDAYQTLRKPVPRAEYLLVRGGMTIGDNERLDPAFLMEILELREELAEARAAGQTVIVAQKQDAMVARRKGVLGELPALFATNDLVSVKERLMVLRYLNRYLEECEAALDED